MKTKTGWKNIGLYAASGVCLLTLAAAIGIGTNSLQKQAAQEAALSQAETPPPKTESADEVPGVSIGGLEVDTAEVLEQVEDLPTEEPVEEPVEAVTFASPLEGEVLQPYSGGELVKNETLNEWRTHDGVDIQAAANTPVKCAADGTVSAVTEDALWGTCVTVDHADGYQTQYMGLKSRVEVQEGEQVAVGTVLGYVGETAEAELKMEPHLHFAMRHQDNFVDPAEMIAQ